jgi:hypothetical protein
MTEKGYIWSAGIAKCCRRTLHGFRRKTACSALLGAAALGITMFLGACHTLKQGGASVDQDDPDNVVPELTDAPVPIIQFNASPTAKTLDKISVTITPLDSTPVLYYRYEVKGGVNGNYILMPGAPKWYSVMKVPYFQNEPDRVTLQIHLENASSDLYSTATAVCAFDMDRRTIASTPLGRQDLLPGHSITVRVAGPPIADLKAEGTTGTLVVWLYGLGGADSKQATRWDFPFSWTEGTRKIKTGEMIRTRSADLANSYRDRVDRADKTPP